MYTHLIYLLYKNSKLNDNFNVKPDVNFYIYTKVRYIKFIFFYVFPQKTNYALTAFINMTKPLVNETKIKLLNFNSIESFSNYVNRFFFCIKVFVLLYNYTIILLVLLLGNCYLYYQYRYYCLCILCQCNVCGYGAPLCP